MDLYLGVWKAICYLYCWQETDFISKSARARVYRFKRSLYPLDKIHAHLPSHKGQSQRAAISGILSLLAI